MSLKCCYHRVQQNVNGKKKDEIEEGIKKFPIYGCLLLFMVSGKGAEYFEKL